MAPFRAPAATRATPWATRLLLVATIIAALYLGREVLAPLALALLLTIAALPPVAWMERRGLPRIPAVLLVLLLIVAVVALILYVVIGQALSLAEALPRYETILRAKIASLGAGSGPIEGVFRLVNRLGTAISPADPVPATSIVVAAAEQGTLAGLFGLLRVMLAPVVTLAVTLLLMVFILVQREDVRDRVLRLAGLHELHRTTGALEDATSRLGRFLLMQLVINASFGACMGIGLWAIGLPNAPLWGVLGFALRFVPYLGAPLSAMFPLVLAFATTDGWSTVLAVIVLFAIVDIVASYALEPWLYGASTGVTPIALVLSSAFWAVLWGPIGLILAPAITGCLVILGRHVPALGILDVVLGDTAPLPAQARFYQRLLAGDAEAAVQVLADEAEQSSVKVTIEQLVMPAIAQISGDRQGDGFGPALAVRSARTLLQALESVADQVETGSEVLVLPVGGALDRAAAAAVVAALQEAGHGATMTPDPIAQAHVAVLVTTGEAPRHRLQRAVQTARARAAELLMFAATDAGEQGISHAGLGMGVCDTLPALLDRVQTLLHDAELAEQA